MSAPAQPVQDLARRRDYEALCEGRHADGPAGGVLFLVHTLDLDAGRGDVYVAAGLGLALVARGYGVQLLPRERWSEAAAARGVDVSVAMLPGAEPSLAPRGAWRVAWVRNETDTWAEQRHLPGYDQVLASSQLSVDRLHRVTPRSRGVLPIGVDPVLFASGEPGAHRGGRAVTTVNFWGRVRDAHRALMELPDDAAVTMYGQAVDGAPPELLRWHHPSLPYFALPAVYRDAALVVDDLNHTTLGWGNLNSRFFESAACGALPLANGRLGQRALGLPEVPTYRDADSLRALLERLRADPGEVVERASALRDVVRREHTWEQRADAFLALVAEARASTVDPAPRQPVHFYPDWSTGQPIQDMLNARLGDIGAYPVGVTNLSLTLERRAPDYDGLVLHVHWTGPILQASPNEAEAQRRLVEVMAHLDAFARGGGRVVWTVHNVLPHDVKYPGPESEIAQWLADRADVVHVMAPDTVEACAAYFTLDPAKVARVELSAYEGVYPHWITRSAARRRLGLHDSELVLVAMGTVRPYKGLDDLLDCFDDLVAEDPTLRLLIAGKPTDEPGMRALRERCEATSRVVSHFGYVPDAELQVWLGAADLSVLPYRSILNSAAFTLGHTFGLPVVGPRRGGLVPWEHAEHVRLFDPGTPGALARTVRRALDDLVVDPDGAARARRSARAASLELHPDAMAAGIARALEPVVRRAGRG